MFLVLVSFEFSSSRGVARLVGFLYLSFISLEGVSGGGDGVDGTLTSHT